MTCSWFAYEARQRHEAASRLRADWASRRAVGAAAGSWTTGGEDRSWGGGPDLLGGWLCAPLDVSSVAGTRSRLVETKERC
eukprot:CAMPEP_0118951616 /NCGR_PEP_ID=MMETSP1169-20130426/53424_1 /TAXON_ID=36882 /ORGANISM="Pyramimonas obovata, Strain CCMP722" /LENGTH=80 /DNA_ID=CAMNT_0006898699 /DNA_START=273 /DNA_END=512 /DNA_ORIENTATION=-